MERVVHVADIAQTHALLHGKEKEVFADAGYLGVEKREEISLKSKGVVWYVAAKRGKVKAMAEGFLKVLTLQLEKLKARACARVEHPFHRCQNAQNHLHSSMIQPTSG